MIKTTTELFIVAAWAVFSLNMAANDGAPKRLSRSDNPWHYYDSNRNTRLELAELIAWERSLSLSTVQRYDRNKDGRWDNAERKAALFALVQPLPEALEARYDKNKDGKLNAEERKAMAEEPEEKRKKFIEKFGTLN